MSVTPPGGDPVEELRSAVVVELPSLDAELDQFRLWLDPSRRWGMPTHVTLLYPFIAPDAIGPDAVAELAGIAAATTPFRAVFDHTGWFGQEVAWLAPAEPAPFVDLIGRITAAFPECPPYGGVFSSAAPHATIGQVNEGVTTRMLLAAADAIRTTLPLQQSVTAMALMSGSTEPDSWRVLRRFPMGAA